MQSRAKRVDPTANLEVGRLVLLHDPSSPPLKWKYARVIETFPGKDGVVRVARVRTATGEYKRPVSKLYPLPVAD